MKISVIIPVYNDNVRLISCIQSILDNNVPDIEIIVVDNSSDIPVFLPACIATDAVRLIHEPMTGSYAARNAGISCASGDVFGFTDSDCIVDKHWIENAVAELHSRPGAGFIGGKIQMFAASGESPNLFEKYDMTFYLQQNYYVRNGGFASTANMWVHREVMEKVGTFNAEMTTSGDVEWGNRTLRAGYQGIYCDNVIVNHPARPNHHAFRLKTFRLGSGFYQNAPNRNGYVYTLYKMIDISRRRCRRICFRMELTVRDKICFLAVVILELVYELIGFSGSMFGIRQYR